MIQDPPKRNIIQLVTHKSLNLNTIADYFQITRPAISQQIKILEECGLIHITKQGGERYCHAHLESLQLISKWIEQYKIFWNLKLDALEIHLIEK
ncbi:MAG: ArsR family transcriptional regulator [Saprospiraceae bacterium]